MRGFGSYMLMAVSVLLWTDAKASDVENCMVYDTAAKGAMESRQRGVPLADALKILDKSKYAKEDEETGKAVTAVIRLAFIEAYKVPRYGTDEFRQDAISDFRSKFFGGCLQAAAEQK